MHHLAGGGSKGRTIHVNQLVNFRVHFPDLKLNSSIFRKQHEIRFKCLQEGQI